MRRVFCGGLVVVGLVTAMGCRHAPASIAGSETTGTPNHPGSAANEEVFRNTVALLHDLLKDERNVDKLLFIKFETDELDRLITEISSVAAKNDDFLTKLSKSDPALDLERTALPTGEVATRAAIAKTQRGRLLGSSGMDLQFRLLLTQIQALDYASHLAGVASEHTAAPRNAREFEAMQNRFRQLHDDAATLLRRTESSR